MSIAMSVEQKQTFEEQGFIILEDFFTQPEHHFGLKPIQDGDTVRLSIEK